MSGVGGLLLEKMDLMDSSMILVSFASVIPFSGFCFPVYDDYTMMRGYNCNI